MSIWRREQEEAERFQARLSPELDSLTLDAVWVLRDVIGGIRERVQQAVELGDPTELEEARRDELRVLNVCARIVGSAMARLKLAEGEDTMDTWRGLVEEMIGRKGLPPPEENINP